jgi:hypothetical protein
MYMLFRFDPSKDMILREIRGFGFEDIIDAIEDGHLISISPHQNHEKYPHQMIFYVQMPDGVYMVPCVPE